MRSTSMPMAPEGESATAVQPSVREREIRVPGSAGRVGAPFESRMIVQSAAGRPSQSGKSRCTALSERSSSCRLSGAFMRETRTASSGLSGVPSKAADPCSIMRAMIPAGRPPPSVGVKGSRHVMDTRSMCPRNGGQVAFAGLWSPDAGSSRPETGRQKRRATGCRIPNACSGARAPLRGNSRARTYSSSRRSMSPEWPPD